MCALDACVIKYHRGGCCCGACAGVKSRKTSHSQTMVHKLSPLTARSDSYKYIFAKMHLLCLWCAHETCVTHAHSYTIASARARRRFPFLLCHGIVYTQMVRQPHAKAQISFLHQPANRPTCASMRYSEAHAYAMSDEEERTK